MAEPDLKKAKQESAPAKEVVFASQAPAAIGPYSHAVKANGFLFVSGQIGVDASTGEMAQGVEAQAKQVLLNLKNVLEAGGSSLDRVVKTTVLLANMDDFAAVNALYAESFPSEPPARACYAALGLPKNALVEIEAVALSP